MLNCENSVMGYSSFTYFWTWSSSSGHVSVKSDFIHKEYSEASFLQNWDNILGHVTSLGRVIMSTDSSNIKLSIAQE
jgi:hypothetical protein